MRTAAAVTALVVWLAVSGCSSDEAEPSTLPAVPSASSSTRPSASPAAVAPSIPPVPSAAESATPQGATAFAKHYLEVLTTAFHEADARSLRQLSDADCGGCNNFIAAVEASATEKERTEGGIFEVVFAEAPPLQSDETIVELRYLRSAATIVDSRGTTVTTLAADPPLDAQMRVRRLGESWLVLGFRATPT